MSIQIVMMLPPRAASVSLARHALGEALSIPGVSPDCIHEAQLALSEACSNILRHRGSEKRYSPHDVDGHDSPFSRSRSKLRIHEILAHGG